MEEWPNTLTVTSSALTELVKLADAVWYEKEPSFPPYSSARTVPVLNTFPQFHDQQLIHILLQPVV
jgi:hypothetical protein